MENLIKNALGQWEILNKASINPHHKLLTSSGFKHSVSSSVPYAGAAAEHHLYEGKDRSVGVIKHPKTGKWEWESTPKGAKSPSHGGMDEGSLRAHIGKDMTKSDMAAPPPPPTSSSDYSQAGEPVSITGVNMKKDDIHPRHLGSVDHGEKKIHVFASSASHHKHLPGLHVEAHGASSMGSDPSTWHPAIHAAVARAKEQGYPRVVAHEPSAHGRAYNQSTMKVAKEDSSLTSQSADIPEAGRVQKSKLKDLKKALQQLKADLSKAKGKEPPDLGEYWKEPLNLPNKNKKVKVASKIIYNVGAKDPSVKPMTALEEISHRQTKIKEVAKDEAENEKD